MARQTANLTKEYLEEILHYNKDTGVFTWNQHPSRKNLNGKAAGSINGRGYYSIKINGVSYKSHQLAFLLVNGKFPTSMVDHINGIITDNRWTNLREATNTQNQHNTKLRIDSHSGVKGVCWNKSTKKWLVHIRVNGKQKYLGSYEELELAALVSEEARVKYFKEFSRNCGV